MKRKLNLNVGIVVISLFYIFGALILFLSMVTNYAATAEQITLRHGLPLDLKFIFLPAIAILAIFISYGLYSHSRWGYFLTLIYQIYFGLVSFVLFLSTTDGNLTFLGSFIWSLLVVIYLLMKRRIFFHSKIVSQEIPA
jgi:hypothetical protein